MNHRHNRRAVVKEGIELFWGKGYHHLGVDEICRETGMTKGAFYNAFKSKENFLLTTIHAYGDELVGFLQEQLSKNDLTPYQKLFGLYENMLKAQPENNFKGCLVNNMMSEMGALNIQVAEMATDQFNRFLSVIEPIVLKAQEDGDLNKRLNSKVLAEVIHTMFFGLLTRAKSNKTASHKLMASFFSVIEL